MSSAAVRVPGSQVERRTTGVEFAVPPDDVRDSFGLDFAFRPPGIVVDVEVEQGVRVLVSCRDPRPAFI
jgi:hypothetical protein